MLNQVSLMGRLTRDPELRSTANGVSVASITIAVDRDYGKEDKQTDFFDVVCWRHTAELVCKHFRKGSLIAVAGRLQSRRWEDKSGAKRSTVEVVAGNVYFCERKSEGAKSASADYTQGDYGYQDPSGFEEIDDGEVPF